MGVPHRLHRILASTLLLGLCAAVPDARAEYGNGAFYGWFTSPGASSTFTLPAGGRFPQVTLAGAYVPADGDNHVVSVRNGMAMDFVLTTAELDTDTLVGHLRFTLFWLDTPHGPRILLLGTYTLDLDADGVPYQISGPLVGDSFTLYLPGKDTANTPGDPTDDLAFLVKVHATGVGAGPDALLGRSQILLGNRVLATMNEPTSTTTTAAGLVAALVAPGLPAGTTFNQAVPADGSADVVLGADAPAAFASGVERSGTIGADPYVTSSTVLRLTPAGIGLGLNTFTRTLPGGRTMEGFSLSDVGAGVAGDSPYEGHIFAFVTGQTTPALYLGTMAGTVTATGATGTVAAELVAVDSAPPEVFTVGDRPILFADRFTRYETYAWDLNGWQDLKSVQLLINDSRAQNRILARYDARTNRLSLFNRALRRWVGRCAPGTPGTIKTPWVTLDCGETSILRGGETVGVAWSLRPSARMLPVPSPSAFVKATDQAGQIAGWRSVSDPQVILPTGP